MLNLFFVLGCNLLNKHSCTKVLKTWTYTIIINDRLFGCRIIHTNTIHITSNDRSFGCPIIYTDTIHNVNLFTDTFNNAQYNKAPSVIF